MSLKRLRLALERQQLAVTGSNPLLAQPRGKLAALLKKQQSVNNHTNILNNTKALEDPHIDTHRNLTNNQVNTLEDIKPPEVACADSKNTQNNVINNHGKTLENAKVPGVAYMATKDTHRNVANNHFNPLEDGKAPEVAYVGTKGTYKTVSNNHVNILEVTEAPDIAHAGTRGTLRSVTSNAVCVVESSVFAYEVQFNPQMKSEGLRISFINKHLARISQHFIFDGSTVYLPRKLENDTLQTTLRHHIQPTLTTTVLTFKEKVSLGSLLFLQLFSHIGEAVCETIDGSQVNVIPNYVPVLRNCNGGTMLSIDRQYYIVQIESVADMLEDYQQRYGERYSKAMDVFVRKKFIYHRPDGELYKTVEILLGSSNLKLKKLKGGQQIHASLRQCHMAKIASDMPCLSNTPADLLTNIRGMFDSLQQNWNLQISDFVKAHARVLPPEMIIFGDGVKCMPNQGIWEADMYENEVITSVDLWCWLVLYAPGDESIVKELGNKMQQLQDDTGVSISKPLLFPIASDTIDGYLEALEHVVINELQLVVVILPQSENQPQPLIKHVCCVRRPVPVQIITSTDVQDLQKMHNLVLRINTVLGGCPWTVNLPFKNWMVSGIAIHEPIDGKTLTACSFITSMCDDATQWYSKAVFLEQSFVCYLKAWLVDTLRKYRSTNGVLPAKVVIYHTCTSEEARRQLSDAYRGFSFSECFQELQVCNRGVCVILVEANTGTSYYKSLKSGFHNVPPGTVVDNTITTRNACDFFLMSHCAPAGVIARPTHYEVVIDTGDLAADDVEALTFKLCHLYYKQARVAEMPAPCLYAHELSVLVTEIIRRIPSPVLDEYLYYL